MAVYPVATKRSEKCMTDMERRGCGGAGAPGAGTVLRQPRTSTPGTLASILWIRSTSSEHSSEGGIPLLMHLVIHSIADSTSRYEAVTSHLTNAKFSESLFLVLS
jgi:hypothetical protein